MYLSKLDIVGFKSFAQKTSLVFTSGISAVVGPNGAGKSNIVDAIRWVLGEQKTSVLRSDVMENVIFNGTRSRKPLGMAEVSLTIENNKNILPSEYNEVVVTRRLFRSGESEFLLNNTRCRLRDIVDLFMDTGLGADSYSVIELKMVEAILSGRGDDRRSLFEEAAGIKKYKLQRKEASRKLNDTLSDLLRVNDLLEEIRKNVNTLQRHAQKTRRYNVLNEEYRAIDAKLSFSQYQSYNAIIEQLNFEIQTLSKDKDVVEAGILEKNMFLTKQRTDYESIENELNSYMENEVEIEKKIGVSKQEVAVSNERLLRISKDEVRLNDEIANIGEKLEYNGSEINKTRERISSLELVATANKTEFTNASSLAEIAVADTINIRNEVQQISQNIQFVKSSIDSNKQNIVRNADKKLNLQNKIRQFEQEKEKLQHGIVLIDVELSGVSEQAIYFQDAITEKDNLLISQREHQSELQAQLDIHRQEISRQSNELHQRRASYDFLHNLVDTNETSKFLLSSNDWSDDVEKLMLSESIAVDVDLQSAISVIFSNYSDYFISKSHNNSRSAISLLREHNKGKAGFICLDLIPTLDLSPSIIPQGNGVVGWFSEIIRCDNQLRNAVRLLFSGLLIVDDIEIGKSLMLSNSNIKAVVSKSGEFFHCAGAIYGGSIKEGESARFGKLEKMNKITDDIKIIEESLKSVEESKKDIELQLSRINLQSLITEIRAIEDDRRDFENHTSQLNLKRKQIQNNFDLIDKNCENYTSDINDLEGEITQFVDNSELFEKQYADIKNQYECKNKSLESAESVQKLAEIKVRNIEIDFVRINSDIGSLHNDLKRLVQQEQNYHNSVENKRLELIQNAKLNDELVANIEKLNKEIEALSKFFEEVRIKVNYVSQKRKSIKEQVEQLEVDISDMRKTNEKLIDNIHQKEIKLSETNTWLQNVSINFESNYQYSIVSANIEIPLDFSEDAARQQRAELKQKLQNLGSINFAAIEEYEEEKSRLEFLERQVADLTNAEKTLRETIEEINRTAERNFINTFSQIRINFQTLFRKLFNGEGDADITFDEHNPLESDIRIIARPPNKRPNSIEQLSGGEKTLTAIALLFAIYLVKPSPFCILDEVDAPLDDNNIHRFLTIIRDFSAETQFLIVTHNKTTMTAADTLYGVTMQEPGISKTASVRIDEIEG